jgi:hypothetical protein
MSLILLGLCLGVGLAGGQPSQAKTPAVGPLQPDPGWKELGRSLWFDPREKCAIVRARIVLREGVLEHLLCVKGTKEHEAIVSTDAPPRAIHTALILSGAVEGHPVQFQPKFEPPAGTPIAIEMRWLQEGKLQKADAREWVWDEKTRSTLAIDWVFAGSVLYDDPITKKKAYAADEGDLITVANFASAILDLPIASSANDAERTFSANTKKIPPLGTEVFLVLNPLRKPRAAKPNQGAR